MLLQLAACTDIDTCEVIVVTDYKVLDSRQTFPMVRFIETTKKNIPFKRNRGIEASTADIVAFLDDDCIPDPTWILCGKTFLKENPAYCGVQGITSVPPAKNKTTSTQRFERLSQPGFRTNNIFYRKSALLSIDLFDERFAFQREDSDLAFSLMEQGGSIAVSNTIRVTHCHRPKEPFDLLKNIVNRRFDPLLHKKHPALYRALIKTPITPTIIATGIIYGLLGALVYLSPQPFFPMIPLALYLLLFTLRSRSTLINDPALFWGELATSTISPPLYFAIMLYGSLKFRNLLLF